MTLAGRYKIHGNARFLSHQETMRVIQRAIVRSGIVPVYSQGFNPHPRFSLPLPRNVGLASDDELFCIRIQRQQIEDSSFRDLIAAQLPQGFELVSVEIKEKPVTYQPVEIEYLVQSRQQADIHNLNKRIQAGQEIIIERSKEGATKNIDVGKFLKSFEIADQQVRVICKVLPTGTIRPDEILKLLGIDSYEISSSIIRKQVIWQSDN